MVVEGGCGGLCGSGSLSELSEDESEEDDDEDDGGRPVGGRSRSGSSLTRGRCGGGPEGEPGSLCLLL